MIVKDDDVMMIENFEKDENAKKVEDVKAEDNSFGSVIYDTIDLDED